MTDYTELFKNLQKNLEHFKFGNNGEGWFGGFNIDKDGNFNGVNLKDFAKKVSDILGYDVNFDEDNEKKPTEKKEEKKETKNENSCNCNRPVNTAAVCAYNASTENGQFKVEVLIPGETVDNFRVSVNNKAMKLKIARRIDLTSGELPWYAACQTPIEIDLPEGVALDTFKKNSSNGLLVITAKIDQGDIETEI